MPTSGEAPTLTPLDGLRARLTPGALCFSLATRPQALELRVALPQDGRVWLSWRQRDALLSAWRPVAQERYHSVAGRDAPSVRDWLAPRFRRWQMGAQGVSSLVEDTGAREAVLARCHLEALAHRPVSLLSNGEAARACLAAALAQDPRLLVLEDLCEGLDAAGRRLLGDVAAAVAAEGQAVLVLASRPSLFPWSPLTLPLDAPARPPLSGKEIFHCQGLDLDAGAEPLLRGLDWTLRGGDAWWLQGANGAGKSSLLAYLTGEHPQAWARSWRLLGQERPFYTPLGRLRGQVAWVSPETASAAGEALEEALGRALDSQAPLLLLDEPLRGLDRVALDRWEHRLAQAPGPDRAIVFVTHDPCEAPAWLNRVLRLPGGGAWEQA